MRLRARAVYFRRIICFMIMYAVRAPSARSRRCRVMKERAQKCESRRVGVPWAWRWDWRLGDSLTDRVRDREEREVGVSIPYPLSSYRVCALACWLLR